MPIPITCVCGYSTMAPDSAAGRRGKCKRCGATIAIPSPDDDITLADPDPPAPAYVAPVVDTSEDDEEEVPAPAIGREPWYYRFLVVYAYLIIGAGTALGLGWIVLAVVLFLRQPSIPERPMDNRFAFAVREPQPPSPLLLLAGLVPGTCMIFASCVIGAPILLGVDAARNLRVIRLQGHLRG
jgi:hypothetical protein